jgi:hypothetical protein
MVPRDLLGKLEREMARLEAEVSPDTYFNFAITAYHLCDWIKNDPRVSASARGALEPLRKQLPIRVFRDLANGSKHFQLTYPNTIVVDATCTTGFGVGRYGKGAYGQGERAIQVTLSDGTLRDGLALAREATTLWQTFFTANAL